MATHNQSDVNEMFQRMGEKLGWFKHKDMGDAFKTLSKSAKKKSTKSRLTKTDNDKENTLNCQRKKKSSKQVTEKPASTSSALKVSTGSNKLSTFDGILSSDSDSSFTLAPEQLLKPAPKTTANKLLKQTLVLESDSDEEPVQREDTYVSCVGESLWEVDRRSVGSTRDSKSGSDDSDTRKHSRISMAANETILMKNRMSVGSLFSELDSFGDPLLESTRIYRKSSAGYRQMFQDIGESSEENASKDYSDLKTDAYSNENNEGKETVNRKHGKETDVCDEFSHLGLSEHDHLMYNDTKFVSALEVLGETDESSMSDTKITESVRDSDESASDVEEIEVVDVGVQTDLDMPDSPLYQSLNFLPKQDAYREETVVDESSINTEELNSPYDQATVASSNFCTTSNTNSSNIYEQITQNKGTTDLSLPGSPLQNRDVADNYSLITIPEMGASGCTNQLPYDQPTVDIEVEGDKYNSDITQNRSTQEAFDQQTVLTEICTEYISHSEADSDVSSAHEVVTKKVYEDTGDPGGDDDNEIEANVNLSDVTSSSGSVYEVRDVAIQTDSPSVLNTTEGSDDAMDEDFKDTDKQLENKTSVACHDKSSLSNDTNSSKYESFQMDADVKDGNISEDNTAEPKENVISSDDTEVETVEVNNSSDRKDSAENEELSVEQSVSESDNSEHSSDSSSEDEIARGLPSKVPARKRTGTKSQSSAGEQSWRDSKRYDSDSSDDNLEDFFQKMRGTNKAKRISSSESEEEQTRPMSMTDFIVEDDEVSSGTDDDAFYLRETQIIEAETLPTRMRNKKEQPPAEQMMSSDEGEAFSSKLYPSSVTKHKKTKKKMGSWSFSSESEDENDVFHPVQSHKKKHIKTKDTKDKKMTKEDTAKGKTVSKAIFDLSLSEDDGDDGSILPVLKTNRPAEKTDKKHKSNEKETGSSSNHGILPVSDDENALSEVIPYVSGLVTLPGNRVATENSKNRTKGNNPCLDMSDSDSDDQLTSPALFKTPNPVKRRTDKGSNNSVFKTPKSRILSSFVSDDEDSYDSVPSASVSSADNSTGSSFNSLSENLFQLPTPVAKGRTPKSTKPQTPSAGFTYNFMKSLSDVVDKNRRDPVAARYVAGFKKLKEDLTRHLFKMYNETVFENKLPMDLPIIWNKRLLRTAGFCAYKKHKSKDGERTARIELSTKVCDSTERVRDTLIHELCHAAVWLLNGVNGGHGPYWKFWARLSNKVHPELPAIGRCHSYSINTKFTYRCTQCGYSIGRHSKSLDTEKKVCGHCHGKFELLQNPTPTTPRSAGSSASSTPRTPNRFAMFVKDNYQTVKGENKDWKHGDVMKELSKLFAESKIAV